jgi:hypothetical protein
MEVAAATGGYAVLGRNRMNDLPVPVGWWNRHEAGDRLCSATNRDGKPCRRAAAPFQMVCHLHGAKTPLGLKAARERLALLLEPALEVLFRATRQAPPCPHCGRSDSDRDPTAVRAAGMILDRAGLSPALALNITTDPSDSPHIRWVPMERLKLITQWLIEARMAMNAGAEPEDQREVIDAVATNPHPETNGVNRGED